MNNFDKSILEQAFQNRIITIDEIRNKVEQMKLNAVLEQYEKDKETNKVWKAQGTDTRWKFKKEDGKIVAKTTEEKLKKAYIDYYISLKDTTNEKDAKKITFEEMFFQWIEYQESRPTIASGTTYKYRTTYNSLFKGTSFMKYAIGDIDEDDITDFLTNLIIERKLRKKRVSEISGYINNTLDRARKKRLITENPFDFVEVSEIKDYCIDSNNYSDTENEEDLSKKERVLTTEEMKLLIKQLHKDQNSKPFYFPYYAIEVCCMTGLRVGEVVALKWSDIRKGELHILRSEHRINEKGKPIEFVIGATKNKKTRKFPISSDLQSLFNKIRNLQEELGINSPYIFEGESGRILAPHVSNCCFRETARAGLDKQGVHAIRRTVSSNLHKQGIPDATICLLLGHTEKVNKEHYDYDVTTLQEKLSAISLSFQQTA